MSDLYGIRTPEPGEVPLGFLTPYEATKAGAKRVETVDAWIRDNGVVRDANGNLVEDRSVPPRTFSGRTWYPNLFRQPEPTQILDNVPLPGFKFTEMIRRYRTSNVVWRVIDPRNFELEISSNNLAYIMQTHGIQKDSLISGNCVWARIGNQNYLIPEDTPYWAFCK